MAIAPVQSSAPQDNRLKTKALAKSLPVEVSGRGLRLRDQRDAAQAAARVQSAIVRLRAGRRGRGDGGRQVLLRIQQQLEEAPAVIDEDDVLFAGLRESLLSRGPD